MTEQRTDPTTPMTGTLPVPGATLRYEVRGDGPLLLLIPGGSGDADVFDGVAPALADHFSVASYDPRGIGRSTLEGPAGDQHVEVHAADAGRLIDLLSPDEPAYVLGCGSGAVASLHLLVRHPDRLRLVIAHEPPLAETLPDPAPARALFTAVRDTAVREGVRPAMTLLEAGLSQGPPVPRIPEGPEVPGVSGAPGVPHAPGAPATPPEAAPVALPPHEGDKWARMRAGSPYFLQHVLSPFTQHTPDMAQLKDVSGQLLLGVGADSRGLFLDRLTRHLAETLGTGLVTFPGGHVGPTEHPTEFAGVLRETLRAHAPAGA